LDAFAIRYLDGVMIASVMEVERSEVRDAAVVRRGELAVNDH